MNVRMLTNKVGYPDGITAQVFKAGEVYDLPASLSGPWLEQGLCEEDKAGPGPSETKGAVPKAPQTKPPKGPKITTPKKEKPE